MNKELPKGSALTKKNESRDDKELKKLEAIGENYEKLPTEPMKMAIGNLTLDGEDVVSYTIDCVFKPGL